MKIVSLFSGAGGLDLGLMRAGHNVVWANDVFEDAVATYRTNIGNRIDPRDISAIPSCEIPYGDVIVGGFPCQGFSVANWKRKIEDDRNLLYKEMVRVVSDKQPWFFVIENVKGILSLGKGAFLELIKSDFCDAGYTTYWDTLNAADYGVPQTRSRFVMLGIRKDLALWAPIFPPKKTHQDPKIKQRNPSLQSWVTVGQALSQLPEPEEAPEIPNHDYSRYKLRFNGYVGHRYVHPDLPAPSVTARGDDKGGVVVLHHPRNHRRMSARELARVQSFPDDYIFCGSRTSAYRQIANAVPPELGKAIGIMLSENHQRLLACLSQSIHDQDENSD